MADAEGINYLAPPLRPSNSESKEWMKFVTKRQRGEMEKGPFVACNLRAFLDSSAVPKDSKKAATLLLQDHYSYSQLEKFYQVFLNCLTFIQNRTFTQFPVARREMPRPPVDKSSIQGVESVPDFSRRLKSRLTMADFGDTFHIKQAQASKEWPPTMSGNVPLNKVERPPSPPPLGCVMKSPDFQMDEFVKFSCEFILQRLSEKSRKKIFKDKQDLTGRGYGSVYSYRSTETGSKVAAKRFANSSVRESIRALIEVCMLAKCKHPNIIEFYGAYIVDSPSEIWLVMEHIQGISLADVARSSKLKKKQVSYIVKRTLRALQYLHQLEIVHRNIRPANVMINTMADVKLIDFGLATTYRLTQNKIVGILQYISPEMMTREPLDGGVDIWALGMSMIDITVGLPTSQSEKESLIKMMMNSVAGVPPLPPPTLEESFKDFIKSCLVCKASVRPSAEGLQTHSFFEEEELPQEMHKILKQAIIQSSTIAMQGL
eukprot:CAMPEP_0201480170 /NCGR_PEP_ID=MMETSP0151_2-20130828/4711_1 /ASSEMBLY_ACC=CAM_ASM_000257 /TAXON_ID=200890 /ORGANISM="Paramoeba atlantica, Strain 621/1 / CCAP 1560/9" /LENGTH=487 /DNA_ID=CAMNT_0047861947 /DNA_START=31 /DNA_END=1494 /DNA_ORIENTATION=-